jgi:hypothetical protein
MGLLFTIASPLLEHKKMLQSILDELRELKNPKKENDVEVQNISEVEDKIKPTTLEEDEKNSPNIEAYIAIVIIVVIIIFLLKQLN